MEKDKMIFEYLRTIKENDRNLEQTKKLVIVKDENLSKAKDEIKDLRLKLKSMENQLLRKDEEYGRMKNMSEDKILMITKEKNMLDDKLNQVNKVIEQLQNEIQELNSENKKIDKQLNKYKQNLANNNDVIKNNEKMIEELKKENKNIAILKKQIENLDGMNLEMKNELKLEIEKVENLTNDKENLEKRIKTMNDLISGENSIEKLKQNLEQISYQLELKLKENENLESYSTSLQEKYKSLLKENEIFVNTISNELGKTTGFLDSLAESENIYKEEINNNKIINLNKSNFSLKYELINKNFEILKSKIVENHNTKIHSIEKLKRNLKEQENVNDELSNEKTKYSKDNNNKNQVLVEQKEKLMKLSNEHEKTKEQLSLQIENYQGLKMDFEELIKKYELIYNEHNNLINNALNLLSTQFSSEDTNLINKSYENSKSNELSDKIIEYINLLLKDNSKLQTKEVEFSEKIQSIQSRYKSLEDERTLLLTRVERLTKSKEDELNQLDNSKNEEIKKHRESLYEKINSLTKLLEESNYMMSEYENENIKLKKKCEKLEYNLQMLTDSHLELEKNINSNFTSLNIELEQKDYKYNTLLRELELKEMHLASFENLLKRKEEEIEKMRENHKLYLSTSFKNNLNNESVEEPNQYKNFNINYSNNEKKHHSRTNSQNHLDYKISCESNNLEKIHSSSNIQENLDIRIPGKIYSKKKKF